MQLSKMVMVSLLVSSVAFAKKGPDKDHANHYTTGVASAGDVEVHLVGSHSRETYVKAKLKFMNEGNDWLVIEKDAPVFKLVTGEFSPDKAKKVMFVEPHDTDSHTYTADVQGGGFLLLSYILDLKGVSTASANGTVFDAPDFTLPASQTTFEAGPFSCTMKKSEQKTDLAIAKFECEYRGEKGHVGFIRNGKLTVTIPDGKSFGNEAKGKEYALAPGDKASFKAMFTVIQPRIHGVDMQFTELVIHWNDTFSESATTPLEFAPMDFTLDVALTAEKN